MSYSNDEIINCQNELWTQGGGNVTFKEGLHLGIIEEMKFESGVNDWIESNSEERKGAYSRRVGENK